MKVFDYEKKVFVDSTRGLTRGIVYASDTHFEWGWFTPSKKNILVSTREERGFHNWSYGLSRESLPGLVYSNLYGTYIIPSEYDEETLLNHKYAYGSGRFPYDIERNYEAADSMSSFKGAQEIVDPKSYKLAEHLKYTFGIEFETSGGFVPKELCYRDGLIPLRDGSISGVEYSTVVLKGNDGLNLLRQQTNTLKKYTIFNKECALHIHLGGYPVTERHIYALYYLWICLERRLIDNRLVPPFTFNTAKYKANGKDYCKMLPSSFETFSELYYGLTETPYLGSLIQPHRADVAKKAKWNIKTRYFALNLINMLCYSGPKTVEFRFLRPTFNFRKITLWLGILNAVLMYAEKVADEFEGCSYDDMYCYLRDKATTIERMIGNVYPREVAESIFKEMELLRLAVINQTANGDNYGRDTFLEDAILTDDC